MAEVTQLVMAELRQEFGFSSFSSCASCHRILGLALSLSLSPHLFQQYVRAKCPRAMLPPLYALELLTIYAWEMGTLEDESFRLDEGLTTVMELLQEYELLCIYWTRQYTFENPIIEDCVRKQLQRERYWAPGGSGDPHPIRHLPLLPDRVNSGNQGC